MWMGWSEIFRAKLAYCRRRLADGADPETVLRCLKEVAEIEAELRRIESGATGNEPLRRQISWSGAFTIGHPILDVQHIDLIRQINQLCTALDAKEDMTVKHDSLRTLVHSTKRHFADEIGFLREAAAKSLPGIRRVQALDEAAIDAHIAAHGRALAELQALVGRIEGALADELPCHVEELVGWFVLQASQYDDGLNAVFQPMFASQQMR